MTTTLAIRGTVKFRIAGQEALPKWQQTAVRNALAAEVSPPNELRFQCRIATDARENFAHVPLADGSALNLHPKSKPQFGKNSHGDPYLTVVVVHDKTGQSFRLTWKGAAVPRKMQEVAVKHDQGLRVAACTVAIKLEDAEIAESVNTYASKAGTVVTRKNRETADEYAKYPSRKSGHKPKPRYCARITESDLS